MLWKGILIGAALFIIQLTPGVSAASDWDDFSGEIYIGAMLPAVNSIIVSGVWSDHRDRCGHIHRRHSHGGHHMHRSSHHYAAHHGVRHHATREVVHHRKRHHKPHANTGKHVARNDGKGKHRGRH
jgi:hypothetical protein